MKEEKEKLEKLEEQVDGLYRYIQAMELLMGERSNSVNVKECINEVKIKVYLMLDTFKDDEED